MTRKYMINLNQRLALFFVVTTLVLAGCSSRSLNRAPVEERTSQSGTANGVIPPAEVVKQPQGFENAGKPGYYTVKPGDTLLRISMDHGQSAKEIAAWSHVDNPNRIEVGQVLRVVPPVSDVVVKPVSRPNVVAASVEPAASAAASSPTAVKPVAAEGEVNFIWPTSGAVVAGFEEVVDGAKNQGIDVGGVAGQPVVAAADGKVIYAGAAIPRLGNLIILKHGNVFLTAYAHNQALLVKEDQLVLKGQKIAEMGNSGDAKHVKLHFEMRRQGNPVDPSKYLPAR
jgi:lipoprotein NlpD